MIPAVKASPLQRDRPKSRLGAACLCGLLLAGQLKPVLGNPAGGVVVAGSATIGPAGSTLTINQSTASAIINWQQFSIAGGETTKFIVPSALSATLNRVTGGNPSQIYGNLQSNGIVYLVNPNGIVVGPNGRIDTAGFMGSTLDVSNQQFLNGGNLEFSGSSSAAIDNQGTIHASMGDVYLIANQVNNEGTISAAQGTAGLAAGSDILFQQAGSQHLFVQPTPLGTRRATGVTNAGAIGAAAVELRAAGGNAYALAINNSGVIAASGYKKINGQVYLTSDGGNITNSGKIKATTTGGNGGTIVLDGTGTTAATGGAVTNSGTMDASATVAKGQGGAVTVQSKNGAVVHSGAILARGGQGGTGGNVELSGDELAFQGTVDTTATDGVTGALLIDPVTFTVAATGGDETGAQVGMALNSNNVTLSATQSVLIEDNINWATSNTLTLQINSSSAGANITIAAAITGTAGGLTINGTGNGATVMTSSAGAVDVANFILQGNTTWLQAGNLPAFAATNNFELQNNSTFLRVASGSGTTSSPGVIVDVYGLQGIGSPSGNLLGDSFVLGHAINASSTGTWNNGAGFVPIGNASNSTFTGVLNGAGYAVNGLVISSPGGPGAGLFGTIGTGGQVSNLAVTNAQVSAGNNAGIIAYDNQGTIQNSSSSGTVSGGNTVGGLVSENDGAITGSSSTATVSSTGGGSVIGGLAGSNNSGGTITISFSSGTVSGIDQVGGLLGVNNGQVSQSYSTATVSGTQEVGGLVGDDTSAISNSYSDGTVTGSSSGNQIGGLVGYLNGGTVTDAYTTTPVTGGANTGALIGQNNGGTIVNSFWDTSVAGLDLGVGSDITNTTPGVVAATTSQLETQAFITSNSPSSPAWNFTSIWTTNGDTTAPQLAATPATTLPTIALDTISGTDYLDGGVTLDAGASVYLLYNGNVIGSTTTNGSGAFSFNVRPANLTSGVLLTGAANGNTYLQFNTPAASVTGSDIWGGTLRILADVASDTALATAAGNSNNAGVDYSGGNASLNTASGVNISLLGNFAQDGIVSDYTMDGNISAGGTLTTSAQSELTGTQNTNLSGSSVTLAGTFNSTGSLNVTSNTGQIALNNVGSAGSPATAVGLTLNATTAVYVNGSYLNTAGGNFSATGTGYTSVVDSNGIADGVELASSTINAQGGNVNIQGHAGYVLSGGQLTAGEGVRITQTSVETNANGNLTVNGTSSLPNTGSNVSTGTFTGSTTKLVGVGIYNNAGNVISTAHGNLNITGNVTSGTTTASSAYVRGVEVIDGAVIQTSYVGSTAAGNLNITGNTNGSTSYDNGNIGIDLEGYDSGSSTSYLTSISAGNGGQITLNGTGGSVNSDSSGSGAMTAGLRISQNVTISATGNATITLQGHGGSLTSTDGSNLGSAAEISIYSDLGGSNVISSASGNISLTGTGGTSPNGGIGVEILGANAVANRYSTMIESSSGNIAVNGTGGSGFTGTDRISGSVLPNYGIAILDDVTISAGGTGTVTLTGQGGTTTSSGVAVLKVSDTSLDANPATPTIDSGGAFSATTNGNTGLDFWGTVAAPSASLTSNDFVNIDGPLQNTAGSVFIQAPLVTLNAAIDATAGNTVIDDTSQFINNAGASGLLASGGFDWQVWSVNPAGSGQATVDNDGGLTPNYIQYAAQYPGTTPAGSGNGLLYSYAPSVALTLPGTLTKTYDSTTTLNIAANSYTLSATGLVTGDAVGLSSAGALTGTLNSKDVTTANTVTVTSSQVAYDFSQGSIPVYGYNVTSVTGAATVTPAPVTASLTGTVSKVYDGTTSATDIAGANYTLSGVLGGDSVTINGPATGTYASKDVGSGLLVTSSTGLSLAGAQGSDYALTNTTASGAVGAITAAPLTAGLTGVVQKMSDGTTAATLSGDNYTLDTVYGNDVVVLNDPTSGTYDSAAAGVGKNVTVTGLSISGAQMGDYYLVNTMASAAVGLITDMDPSSVAGSGSNLVPPAITPPAAPPASFASGATSPVIADPPAVVSSSSGSVSGASGQSGNNMAGASSDGGQLTSGDAAQLGGGVNNVTSQAASGELNQALGPGVYQNLADALTQIGDLSDADLPPSGEDDARRRREGKETLLSGGEVAVISDVSVKNIALSQAPAQLRNALAGDVLKGVRVGGGR